MIQHFCVMGLHVWLSSYVSLVRLLGHTCTSLVWLNPATSARSLTFCELLLPPKRQSVLPESWLLLFNLLSINRLETSPIACKCLSCELYLLHDVILWTYVLYQPTEMFPQAIKLLFINFCNASLSVFVSLWMTGDKTSYMQQEREVRLHCKCPTVYADSFSSFN